MTRDGRLRDELRAALHTLSARVGGGADRRQIMGEIRNAMVLAEQIRGAEPARKMLLDLYWKFRVTRSVDRVACAFDVILAAEAL